MADFEESLPLVLARVNLESPEDSALVTQVAGGHFCWTAGACEANAQAMADAVQAWADALLLEAAPTAPGAALEAFDDRGQIQSGVQLKGIRVTANDNFAGTISISEADPLSAEGGVVSVNSSGTIDYTPADGFSGTDTFDYTIADSSGATSSATVTVTVVASNDAVAVDDKVTADADRDQLLADLLDNDSGSNLRIVSVGPGTQQGGVVVLEPDNVVRYTPTADFGGIDRFRYQMTDGNVTVSAEVEVNVNAEPVAAADGHYTYRNEELRIEFSQILRNDTDINGDELTVSNVERFSENNGEVTISNESIIYDPPSNFVGLDSIEYEVSDGDQEEDGIIFIQVVDPVLRDDDRFLQFLATESPRHVETAETAAAYYRAIDPSNSKDTLDKFNEATGLDNPDANALYINGLDLGFTRNMSCVENKINDQVACTVENYNNIADGEAGENLIATVAMENTVAPGQDPNNPNAKKCTTFYIFDGNGNRLDALDLDGRGPRFLPGLCNTCHGGAPKSLVNGVYPDNGCTETQFIPWDLDGFLFEDETGQVSRADQEDDFKVLNETILGTNPPAAVVEKIHGWYGGPNMPANNFNGDFTPDGWLASTEGVPFIAQRVYEEVVKPYCSACHAQQGKELQNDISFSSWAEFEGYRDRIAQMVYDEATMPMALLTWEQFWDDPNDPATLLAVAFDLPQLLDVNGDVVLQPGRPLARPGPFRLVKLGEEAILNGRSSRFVGEDGVFDWEIVDQPAGSESELEPVVENGEVVTDKQSLLIDEPGDYRIRLTIIDGDQTSPPEEVVIRGSAGKRAVGLSRDIVPYVADTCANCHLGFGETGNPQFNVPELLADTLLDFIDVNDPDNSRVMLKAAGNHHGGRQQPLFGKGEANYQMFIEWITEGANDN